MRQKMDRSDIEILNPCEDAEYNGWIVNRSEVTIFHSANWAKLLYETYRYRPKYFVLRKANRIKACLPMMEVDSPLTGRRGVSVSFSDYCPAIVANQYEFELLLDTALNFGRLQKWRYAEFRGETFLCDKTACKEFVQHTVQLQEEGEMHAKLRNSSARNIQKAIKQGVHVEIRDDLAGVISFYNLHCLTRKRQGLPPQPKKYFENLHKYLIAEGLGFTALGEYGGEAVAGLICLHYGRNAIYKYGASDDRYQSLRANNLLFWEMIKRCGRDGLKQLSFGRTDLNNTGLMLFKDGWGGDRNNLKYHRYNFTTNDYACQLNSFGRHEAFLRRLPINVLRLIGYLGYRHIG